MPSVFGIQGMLIAAGVAFMLGLGSGGWAVGSWYSPRLESAQSQVKDLGDKLREQNAGIEKQDKDSKARAAAAKRALSAALAAAEKAELEWQSLLQRQAPAGVDVCTAASALISEELAK